MINIVDKAATWLLSKASRGVIVSEYYKRSTGKKIAWDRQANMPSRKEIKNYINAITAATDPLRPRLGEWYRFKQTMHNDDHLMSCVENRYMPVQCAPFKLVDKDGNEDTEAKKMLEKPWRLDLVKHIICESFEGVKLLCMFDLNETGELMQIDEVPQTNFIPQLGIVVEKEYDDNGTSYREGVYANYYLQVGSDWNLGVFSGLATIVLAKKLALGAWLSYIDKYGVPPIFAITERMDSARRDELFEMLENFRMNHFAVLQGNEKIETPNGYNVDAYQTFKSLMSDVADKAISKRILGSSGLTDEKSFVGAAEVQERILKYRFEVDKLTFKYYFNEQVKPRLVKLSPVYAVFENLTFEYDESESLTLKEILEAVKDLSQHYDFDVAELEKITGLPITGAKAVASSSPTEPTPPEPADPQKKKSKNPLTPKGNAPTNLPQREVLSPSLGGFGEARGLVYAATWDKAVEKVLTDIEQGDFDPTNLNKDLLSKTYSRLDKAAELGFGKDYRSGDSGAKIRENLLNFSAQKTCVQQSELQAMRSAFDKIADFHKQANKYSDRQNNQYLEVQAAFVSRRCQFVRDHGEWQQNKDIYPNLKFRTMMDSSVRPAHSALDGIVKGKDDPFVMTHATPLDFSCRCWWEETREKAEGDTEAQPPSPEFSVDPNNLDQVFNNHNSYAQQITDPETKSKIRVEKELAKQYLPYSRVIKAGDKNVNVSDFADLSDLAQNLEAAQKLAKGLDEEVWIRPHINIDGYKNPELAIGKISTLGDLKTYDPNNNGSFKGFVKNAIRNSNKQGAAIVVIDISKYKAEGRNNDLINKLYGDLSKDEKKHIQSVTIIGENKVITLSRKEIRDKNFEKLRDL